MTLPIISLIVSMLALAVSTANAVRLFVVDVRTRRYTGEIILNEIEQKLDECDLVLVDMPKRLETLESAFQQLDGGATELRLKGVDGVLGKIKYARQQVSRLRDDLKSKSGTMLTSALIEIDMLNRIAEGVRNRANFFDKEVDEKTAILEAITQKK